MFGDRVGGVGSDRRWWRGRGGRSPWLVRGPLKAGFAASIYIYFYNRFLENGSNDFDKNTHTHTHTVKFLCLQIDL